MAATTDVVIQNSSNNKQFLFRAVSAFVPRKGQGVISIPLINTSSKDNILFRFMGQEEEVSIEFAIFDDDTDVSNGTHESTVKTVAQQIQYLKDVIFSAEYDTYWTLWDTHDLVYPSSSSVTCVITNLETPLKQGSNTVVVGRLTVKRGRIALT